jgi:hypothetical protein
MAFRGASQVYVSLSFYDNLDQLALNAGQTISTGLYVSDNAICYNDAAVGSLSVGGNQTIYSIQYTGTQPVTGIIGTGNTILSSTVQGNVTTVLYLSNPYNNTQIANNYQGQSQISLLPGGTSQKAILINNTPIWRIYSTPYFNSISASSAGPYLWTQLQSNTAPPLLYLNGVGFQSLTATPNIVASLVGNTGYVNPSGFDVVYSDTYMGATWNSATYNWFKTGNYILYAQYSGSSYTAHPTYLLFSVV